MIDIIDPEEYYRLASTCLQMGSKIVALKAAQRGFYVQTNDLTRNFNTESNVKINLKNWSNRELWCPAFYIERIGSATGSGDSSIAGFLAAFLKGESIEKTLKYANCVGFHNLHGLDAISGIKNWQETTAIVKNKDAELIPVPLENSDWKWDKKFRLWIGSRDCR